MRTVGIIAEYNPLHNGHIYHIEQTRRASGAEALVVALSGNFVQRGEPAIFDKWSRAEHALNAGADLVIEIPTLWSLADASRFAQGGVSILESLGCCEYISFGSECGDASELKTVAANISDNREYFASRMKELRSEGLSFPAAREKAYVERFDTTSSVLSSSNDILGLEYVMASNKLQPLVVPRVGAAYSEAYNREQEFASASGIREALKQAVDVSEKTPEWIDFSQPLLNWDNLFDIARIIILNTDSSLIDECPSGGEGIGNRLKEAVRTCNSFNNLIESAKSKRYTYSRISRLIMQLIIGVDRNKYCFEEVPYLRVLGFNDTGKELMSYISKNELNTKPFITNVNKNRNQLNNDAGKVLDMDLKAMDIYNIICGRSIKDYSDHVRMPVIK